MMVGMVIRELRVYQWSKNLLVFAALIFAQQLEYSTQVLRSIVTFAAFCAASSAMYLVNDIMDVDKDRIHPEKCARPLASGAMGLPTVIAMFLALFMVSLGLACCLGGRVVLVILTYMALTLSYSLGLKNVVIIDILIVAIGFVIRAMAGAIALDVSFSNWLVVCTLFIALFLCIGKRRHEIGLLSANATNHRQVLGHYSVPYLDALNLIVAGAALITYTIYTCSPEVVERLQTDKLYLTLPFVVYGLFRYLYLVHNGLEGGDPTSTLLKDRPLGITVVLWGLACIAIIYGTAPG